MRTSLIPVSNISFYHNRERERELAIACMEFMNNLYPAVCKQWKNGQGMDAARLCLNVAL